jgi:hypothetical protein
VNSSAKENLITSGIQAMRIYTDAYNAMKVFESKYIALGITIGDAEILENGCTGLEFKTALSNLQSFLTTASSGVLTNMYKVLG